MTSLLDIGPLTASVTVRGKTFDVSGIEAQTLVVLLDAFPDLYKAIGMRKGLEIADVVKLGPEIVNAIIAAATGIGVTRDAGEKVKALGLTVGEVSEILSPIISMTFPRGFAPFVEQLTSMVEGVGGAAQSAKALVSTSA
jgi:hypothetical protein